MGKMNNRKSFNKVSEKFRVFRYLVIFSAVSLCLFGTVTLISQNQIVSSQTKSPYKIGERLTYNISFENFENAAYAEIYVVSRGKLQGKDTVELSAKLKSVDLLSAAFYLFDDIRSTFVSSQTGLPFYVRTTSNTSGLPKENISNYLESPTTNYDLLSMIYKVRESGGAGSFSVEENEKVYNFDFAATGGEKIETDAGEFETIVSTAQSEYLTELGVTDFRVNFTDDDRKIPVAIRFRTKKGKFDAKLASIQMLEPEATPEPTSTPKKTPTPKPTRTPKPTPIPYVPNQTLSNELPFLLGERLVYSLRNGTQNLGKIFLEAKERKEFQGVDSLKLVAGVLNANAASPLLGSQDSIVAQVDPDTLSPRRIIVKLNKSLSIFNQTAIFNQNRGIVNFGRTQSVDVPVGTHSILSLAYAIRSFNLRAGLDSKNPINDTRVAVFVGSKAYVLTLRPSNATIESRDGKKIPAQIISIRTGNRNIDRLNLRLWLSRDRKRLPLRFTIGRYQADLIETKTMLPK